MEFPGDGGRAQADFVFVLDEVPSSAAARPSMARSALLKEATVIWGLETCVE
jgi:hypothetical protein